MASARRQRSGPRRAELGMKLAIAAEAAAKPSITTPPKFSVEEIGVIAAVGQGPRCVTAYT